MVTVLALLAPTGCFSSKAAGPSAGASPSAIVPVGNAAHLVPAVCSVQTPLVNLARPTDFAVGSSHPRLWWNADRLARGRAYLAAHPLSAGISAKAQTGDAEAALDLCAAWLLSDHNAAYNPQAAVSWMTRVNFGSVAKWNADNFRWYGEIAILIYDWCYDAVPKADRAAFVAKLDSAVAASADFSWGGPHMPSNNYFWGFLRDALLWSIAAQGESANAATFRNEALVTRWQNSAIPYFEQAGGRGGVAQEGTQYGRYLRSYPVVAFTTLHLDGRSIFDETSFFKAAIFDVIYQTTPGATTSSRTSVPVPEIFPFGDDEMWMKGGSAVDPGGSMGNFMSGMAQLYGSRGVGRYARRWLAEVRAIVPLYLRAIDPGGATADFAQLPLEYFAPGIGYFYTRNTWGARATSVFAQLGSPPAPWGHEHLDAGSFQVWRNGRFLSRESVVYGESVTGWNNGPAVPGSTTIAHNGILFEGVGLGNVGIGSLADGPAIVQRMHIGDFWSYAAVDLSKAYRAHASSHLDRDDNSYEMSAVREIIFVRPIETLVVFDRLVSSAEKIAAETVVKTQLVHFETKPTTDAAGVLSVNGDQALRVTTLLPQSPNYRIVNEGSAGQYRLEIDTSGKALSYLLTVLQARDAGGADLGLTLTAEAAGWNLDLQRPGGGRARIRLESGQNSNGGAIGWTNGAGVPTMHPFLAKVQTITVTDDGPVWTCP